MTTQDFVTWTQKTYGSKNKTAAIKKASELLKVTESAIYQWLNGAKNLMPYMEQLMLLTVENHDLKSKQNTLP